ncbi:hypothetical protein [Microbacterium sp. YJN-G]|uniref:hypothetical protein n=1 Tax=Microbacterium sp. YJN-G TaxID=2763257 RepID=UPI00187763F2|nr:hypothetical protein [Microbacterium sp. YJN-G]
MPAYKVQWQQRVDVTATVTVELDELAAWACEHLGLRTLDAGTLDAGTPTDAAPAGVRRMLELNRPLREELLQRWAATHMPHR